MSDSSALPKVGVLPRVVAAGIENRDGKLIGLATLSLMPRIPDEGSSFDRPVSLEDWPAEIESMLADAYLFASRIEGITGMLQPSLGCLHAGVRLRRSGTIAADHRKRANKLWKELIAESDESVWSALVNVFARGQNGSRLADVRCKPAFGDRGGQTSSGGPPGAQPSVKTDQPTDGRPDVFAYPRGDAALLYGLQRAREVLRAMQGKQAECRIGNCRIKTGGRQFDLGTFSFERKPWLGFDGSLVRLAQATTTLSDGSPDSGLEGFARLDRRLAQERTAQETMYRRQLQDKSRSAQEQAEHRQRYLTEPDVGKRVQALKKHAAKRATSLPPSDCADACGVTTDDSIANKLTDEVKSTHSLGSLPDVDQLGNLVAAPGELDDAFDIATEQARQRLFAILAMPSLARVFNLVVDVEFELNELLRVLGPNPEGFEERCAIDHYGELGGKVGVEKTDEEPLNAYPLNAHYMFLTSNLGRADYFEGVFDPAGGSDPPRVWTLAKLRVPRSDNPIGRAGHFWPCTREEIDIRLGTAGGDPTGAAIRESCAVFQYDAVVDLGVTYCADNGVRNPRYDIVSLDTLQTVESDIQSDRRLHQQAEADPGDRLPTAELGVHTHRTGGLAVIDRWRQDQVVSQITTAQHQIDQRGVSEIVLDAEDMTTGYRLDVGVDVGAAGADHGPALVWRGLMNRKMKLGRPHDGTDWLESAIIALHAWGVDAREHKGERRRRADNATLSIASRLRDNGSERADRAAKTVFAEQIMIAWQGDPLGVDCLDPHRSPEVREEDEGLSMPATGLPLQIHYGLEHEDIGEAYRPPPLRYGWPYHLGLRPVYLGGAILPLRLAIPRYELNFTTGSSLPSPAKQRGRRFLRHERIEAPVLTVPSGIAERVKELSKEKFEKVRKEDPAQIDTGATCVLRTSSIDNAANLGPSTHRIFFPPIMQLEQAARHGVFDGPKLELERFEREESSAYGDGAKQRKKRKVARPMDGLKQLDFSGDRGGRSEGAFPHSSRSKDDQARGPAVFRLDTRLDAHGKPRPRPIPFYPDPAAEFYVIRVRRPQSDDYLKDAIVVPAYSLHPPKVDYPDVLPLAIEIRKIGKRSMSAKRVRDLFPGDSTVVAYADGSGMLKASGHGLPVRHAVAHLAPGEDFEIEVWCIPSAQRLRREFDIVESIAVLLMRESATEHFADGRLDQACLDSLKRYFPDLHEDEKDFAGTGGDNERKPNPLCGPGGKSLPQTEVMDRVAEAICKVLLCRSIPEVAAVTRIHAIHAVDKPIAPSFADQTRPLPAKLRVVRLNEPMRDALLAGDGHPSDKILRLENSGTSWENLSDDGATNAIFDGEIEVELLTTHDVELHATMVSPSRAVFDDVKRGRSAEEKARGAYRPADWVPDLKQAHRWGPLPAAFPPEQSRSLFGFIVDVEGRVTLGKHTAPLLALHDLPEVPIEKRDSDMRSLSLLEVQQRAAVAARRGSTTSIEEVDPAVQAPRVQYLQPFRDGLARKLDLTLVATSRFSNLFPKAGPEATRLRESTSKRLCDVWLPATRRPDPLSAKSLHPSFLWTCEPVVASLVVPGVAGARRAATVVRTCSIRVPFERPHFTSGEGERIGIVIWPPDLLLGASPKDIEDDKVRRSEQVGEEAVKLDEVFSDADLGPGGAFITRWGADPTRDGPRPKSWLIPADAFLDRHGSSGKGAKPEPNVLMPIPRKVDTSQGDQKAPGTAAVNGGQPQAGEGANKPTANEQGGDAAGREFMLVSLLTYEPRFDIDYEHWYIDVAVDAGDVPEPFIRLGLVRFQEHARPELQVSEPIVQWVQVMPKRTITVAAELPDNVSGRAELTVEVVSPAGYDGSAPQVDPATGRALTASGAPFMRAYVLRTVSTSAGTSIQTIVAPEGAIDDPSTQLLPQRTAKGTMWSGTIRFDCPPQEKSEYSVFVEEVETLPSAANPFDPDTGAARPNLVESGPRFAAIVPIKFDRVEARVSIPPARPPAAQHPAPGSAKPSAKSTTRAQEKRR